MFYYFFNGDYKYNNKYRLHRILIDIGHPAHVHLFSGLANSFIKKGCEVLFTVRLKDSNVDILNYYKFSFIVYGHSRKSMLSKIFSYVIKLYKLYFVVRKFKPTITLSHSSFYLSHISWLLNISNITLEDTGNMEQVNLYLPFTSTILSPTSYDRNHGKKHIFYQGFHELAYLHPSVFKKTTTKHHDLPIVLVRFVSWSASHDYNQKGLDKDFIMKLINVFSDKAKVILSCEGKPPAGLENIAIQSGKADMPFFLSEIDLYIGDGATMATECALLGVPTIYTNKLNAGTIDELEKKGLLYHSTKEKEIFDLANMLIANRKVKTNHLEKSRALIKTKINVSAFLIWFVDNYPDSFKVMKEDPDFQRNFK